MIVGTSLFGYLTYLSSCSCKRVTPCWQSNDANLCSFKSFLFFADSLTPRTSSSVKMYCFRIVSSSEIAQDNYSLHPSIYVGKIVPFNNVSRVCHFELAARIAVTFYCCQSGLNRSRCLLCCCGFASSFCSLKTCTPKILAEGVVNHATGILPFLLDVSLSKKLCSLYKILPHWI